MVKSKLQVRACLIRPHWFALHPNAAKNFGSLHEDCFWYIHLPPEEVETRCGMMWRVHLYNSDQTRCIHPGNIGTLGKIFEIAQ